MRVGSTFRVTKTSLEDTETQIPPQAFLLMVLALQKAFVCRGLPTAHPAGVPEDKKAHVATGVPRVGLPVAVRTGWAVQGRRGFPDKDYRRGFGLSAGPNRHSLYCSTLLTPLAVGSRKNPPEVLPFLPSFPKFCCFRKILGVFKELSYSPAACAASPDMARRAEAAAAAAGRRTAVLTSAET